jgi:NADPH:quinone reductase-like Zn-dependent oxidoreductase
MKAIVQDRYGSPDVLELREVDKPVAADNEVLVRVSRGCGQRARLACHAWRPVHGPPIGPRYVRRRGPKVKILGADFAGRVEAVGRSVERFHPGDEVFGEVDGAFAEYGVSGTTWWSRNRRT